MLTHEHFIDVVDALVGDLSGAPAPNVVTTGTLPFDLNKVIDASLKTTAETVADDRGGHEDLHVSSVSEWCTARRVYDIIRYKNGQRVYPPVITARDVRTFTRGHAVHDLLRKWFNETGEFYGDWECHTCGRMYLRHRYPVTCVCGGSHWTYHEIVVHHELPGFTGQLVGSVDGIFRYKQDFYVIEAKTMYAAGWDEINNGGPVQHKHFIQLQLYMHMLGIRRGILVYARADDARIARGGVLVNYEPTIWEWLKTRLQLAERLAESGAPLTGSHKICKHADVAAAKRCPHADLCLGRTVKRVRTVK